MKLLYVTSEAAPFAKTGGLGDVSGALPLALAAKRIGTRVMMPLYSSISDEWRSKMKFVKYIYVNLSWRNIYCGLFELKHEGVTWYFVDNEHYFKRGELYGHFDDGERFAFFSKAVAQLVNELDWRPDVVHCNDWQSALVPIYLRTLYKGVCDDIRCVFTIHNIEYQGRFDRSVLNDVFGLPDQLFNGGTMEFSGGLNLMKGAIELSDAVTTVSPTYADELKYSFYAHGLEGVIAAHGEKLNGILNGIDMKVFDPETDKNICKNYSSEQIAGKAANKKELQKLLGLQNKKDVPIIAMVTRLATHKGLDLVAAAFNEIMDIDCQFVVVGRGEWNYEQHFRAAAVNYSGRFSASIMYNSELAMKIYAGADIFLMPSQAEPCGLSQLIAMRYGTVPVVRETGGLRDTVYPYIPDNKNSRGFTFANYNANDMLYVLKEAVALYSENKEAWSELVKHDMELDFGWSKSAGQYSAIYSRIAVKQVVEE